MENWYNQIEEPVRELVKRLRNNGINTISSCGHEMYIQADIMPDTWLKTIHNITYDWLVEQDKKPEYQIDLHMDITNGVILQCFVEIKLKNKMQNEN